ncbi:MAG TPA: 3'-5' exonuclease [Smithellaceae bacterium]|nr:3'-5' exonuclease [Smithellaceae bacterium]
MINKTEIDERQFLESVRAKLHDALGEIHHKVTSRAREIREHKNFLWENKTGMDHAEKISVRQSIDMSVLTGEAMLAKQKRIQKLLVSPYFGRFDFIERGHAQSLPVYVGIHAFFDEKENKNLIYDWRAPISSLFYDYEIGEAGYATPSGEVSGEIVLKRQYRIRNGQMEFMLESAVNILDDVLQKELSLSSDEKMKNIVATIQRDQNAIIRNENSQVLIIQGVAGSGKTSIALHRIAFLLYRFKETLAAKDILIISPNKVFADYISNVLPELGEEKIPEIVMEKLAHDLLGYKYKFQTFFEQAALLLEKDDGALKTRIQEKSSAEFLKKLDEYIEHAENTHFHPEDLTVSGRLVPSWFIEERFKACPGMPVFERLSKIALDIEHNIGIYYNYDISAEEREKVKTSVRKMFTLSTLRAIYKEFYAWMGRPELFKQGRNAVYEYSDVFPLIYLKIKMEGLKSPHDNVKHLLVDEMQDYTPVQYAVISRLFPCKKTILGDANQSVNPYSSSTSEEIRKVFVEADCVKLCKSYRSTCEITQFAQRILPNTDLVAIERHGEEPGVMGFENEEEELCYLRQLLGEFHGSGYHSMGIICKTQKQAEHLYGRLCPNDHKIHLLTTHSMRFHQGVTVCTAHMAKGLEFDHVIVPHATQKNYSREIDKHLLYVACTRAMHRLVVTFVGKLTGFIKTSNLA